MSEEEIMETKLKCTAPGCDKCLPPKAMWLPEWKALCAAAGRRVGLADFPKFALCGHHGHKLRQSGVRVYRYLQSCERQEAYEARRQSEDLSWQPFADRFRPKQAERKAGGQPGRRRGHDGRGVGQGLSRLSKLDAIKWKRRGGLPAKPDNAPERPASSPSGDSGNGDAAK